MERTTGFARLGRDRIAYEVVGDAPTDLVLTAGSFGAFDTDWEDPVAELYLTGVTPASTTDRVLATVLYTDIVDSTQLLDRMGDTRWRGVLDMHDTIAQRLTDANGGRLIKSTGDGILATFDGPGRAIRFATGFAGQLRALGLSVRTGMHTGEIELRGDDVGGMAVHLAARIMAQADPGKILVSRTVTDLVVGSDLTFEDRSTHRLKGIEGDWPLLAVRVPG